MNVHVQTCTGASGLEEGARVQMMFSLDSGLEVKKEQGSTTDSPCTASTLDSLTVTLSAAAPINQSINQSIQRQFKENSASDVRTQKQHRGEELQAGPTRGFWF